MGEEERSQETEASSRAGAAREEGSGTCDDAGSSTSNEVSKTTVSSDQVKDTAITNPVPNPVADAVVNPVAVATAAASVANPVSGGAAGVLNPVSSVPVANPVAAVDQNEKAAPKAAADDKDVNANANANANAIPTIKVPPPSYKAANVAMAHPGVAYPPGPYAVPPGPMMNIPASPAPTLHQPGPPMMLVMGHPPPMMVPHGAPPTPHHPHMMPPPTHHPHPHPQLPPPPHIPVPHPHHPAQPTPLHAQTPRPNYVPPHHSVTTTPAPVTTTAVTIAAKATSNEPVLLLKKPERPKLEIPPGRKTPRRACRFPGCTKTIKSQGHCQKHGARAKRCKVEGCEKQAQGTHDGMCKRHWKEVHSPKPPPRPEELPPEPQGPSVYDAIIPASIAWRATKKRIDDRDVMPLVAHLRDNAYLAPGWHRNQERASRGIRPVLTPSAQFEAWERQLVMFEIMLISGTMYNSHKDLAHGWGREKGFHSVLVNQICERRGELERKKRSDTGRIYSAEQRESFKVKLHRSRTERRSKVTKLADNTIKSNNKRKKNDNEITAVGAVDMTLPPPEHAHEPVPASHLTNSSPVTPSSIDVMTAATMEAVTAMQAVCAPVPLNPNPENVTVMDDNASPVANLQVNLNLCLPTQGVDDDDDDITVDPNEEGAQAEEPVSMEDDQDDINNDEAPELEKEAEHNPNKRPRFDNDSVPSKTLVDADSRAVEAVAEEQGAIIMQATTAPDGTMAPLMPPASIEELVQENDDDDEEEEEEAVLVKQGDETFETEQRESQESDETEQEGNI